MNPVESVRRHIYKGLRSDTNLFIHNSLRSIIHLLIVCWMVHLMFLFYKERLAASLTFSTISSVVIAAPWCLWSLHSSTLFSKSSYLRLFTNISSRPIFQKRLKDGWNFWTDSRQSLPSQCLRCRVLDNFTNVVFIRSKQVFSPVLKWVWLLVRDLKRFPPVTPIDRL